jgi:hypothetical protein|tara:strand:+ start:384 stop:743 length:360 start_codon:yes stop_codon:yes gene_type:complete
MSNKKLEKKIFILDSLAGEGLATAFILEAQGMNVPVNVQVSTQTHLKKLPRDYDVYIIHYSDTDMESIREIREKQPWSYIVGVFGGSDILSENERKLFDKHCVYFNEENTKQVLQRKTY